MSGRVIREREVVHGDALGTEVVKTIGFRSESQTINLVPHVHYGFEFTCIFSGQAHWVTEAGESLPVHGGQMAITQPDVVHSGHMNTMSPCEICWFVFNPLAGDAPELGFSALELKAIDSSLRSVGNAVVVAPDDLVELLRCMYRTLAEPMALDVIPDAHLVKLRSMLATLMLEIVAGFCRPVAATAPPDRLRTACDFIHQQLGNNIGVNDVAAHVGLSVSRFHSMFREQMGITPGDYIQRTRCDRAKVLLGDARRSITDIAFELGFTTSQYFSTTFKRYTGATPRAFRNRALNTASEPFGKR